MVLTALEERPRLAPPDAFSADELRELLDNRRNGVPGEGISFSARDSLRKKFDSAEQPAAAVAIALRRLLEVVKNLIS